MASSELNMAEVIIVRECKYGQVRVCFGNVNYFFASRILLINPNCSAVSRFLYNTFISSFDRRSDGGLLYVRQKIFRIDGEWSGH